MPGCWRDPATWVAFENPQDLELLFEGDEALFFPNGRAEAE